MFRLHYVPLVSLITAATLFGQEKPQLTCTVLAGAIERLNTPVCLSLAGQDLPVNQDQWTLWEKSDGAPQQVAFQISDDQLCWVLKGKSAVGSRRLFYLTKSGQNKGVESLVKVKSSGGSIQMAVGEQTVLHYQVDETIPPEGYSPLYRRGGYIHPLYTPSGEVLTRIQPADHIHHYGIWNPWTKTHFEGREIDFWNLYKGQGTIKVVGSPKRVSGPVFGEITAQHEHVDLNAPDPNGAKTALWEQWRIRTWNADPSKKIWLVDFESRMDCATDSVFKIEAYRYQGFGFRATEKWDDRSAKLTTSQGKDKSTGNATRARWCDINGASEVGTSGILFMTHPQNHNFPEQLRIWPTGANDGKENVFFNFNPAQEDDWILQPGHPYFLKYRMMVYDGEIDPAEAERYWQDFANPPQIKINYVRNTTPDRILVYTKNGEGYVHDNLQTSVEAIKRLGKEYGFQVDASDNPQDISEENLKTYQAIVLSNTNNETFITPEQKLAFQRYIQAGGGLVGIHSATGSERQWPWFWKVLGGKFRRHPPLQEFDIKIVDRDHPSVMHLPDTWTWEDECYYTDHLNPGIQVIMAADLNSVEDDKKQAYPGTTFGQQIPLSWCQELYGGRQWYTALGHKKEYYANPEFTSHLLGGILWVLQDRKLNYVDATTSLIQE